MRTILSQLAYSHGRRDERLNTDLAKHITEHKDKAAIKELIQLLDHPKKEVQGDSIKVLFKIGQRDPILLKPYISILLNLLQHKNNRLQWGAMIALVSMASIQSQILYKALPQIMEAAEHGTVITRDHAMQLLVTLGKVPAYQSEVFYLMNEMVLRSPVNQLPAYAEKTASILLETQKPLLLQSIQTRLQTLTIETKIKRLQKLIQKLKN